MDFKEIVQKKLGTFIYHEESRDFNQYCQINRSFSAAFLYMESPFFDTICQQDIRGGDYTTYPLRNDQS